MILYSRQQLIVLLLLAVIAGAGLAIGQWRRANPELAAVLESLDRDADNRPVGAPTKGTPDVSRPTPPVEPTAPVATAAAAAPARITPRAAGKVAAPPHPVDLNRATADQLTRLPGVGPVLAARIVAARENGGAFDSVDDLRRVSGIGPAKLAALRDLVTVARSP